jgi:hypothetical protein
MVHLVQLKSQITNSVIFAATALRPWRCHELARPRTNFPRAEVALQQDIAGAAKAVP